MIYRCFFLLGLLLSLASTSAGQKKLTRDSLVTVNGIYMYDDHTFTGTIVEFHDPQHKSGQFRYRLGNRIGEHLTWTREGIMLSRRNFNKDGLLDGLQQAWHPDGTVAERCIYVNGAMQGQCEFWYKNGQMSRRLIIREEQLEESTWYPDGKQKNLLQMRKGCLHGFYRNWSRDGIPKLSFEYDMGRQVGQQIAWSESGVLEFRAVNSGSADRLFRYYPNGNKREREIYADGLVQQYRSYHLNGGKHEARNYVRGVQNGFQRAWTMAGLLIEEGEYEHGWKTGEWKYWGIHGNLLIIENYRNGKLDGPRKTWHKNGQLWVEQNYEQGKIVGKSREWYENGVLKYTQSPAFLKRWHANGKKSWKIQMANGQFHGKGIEWDEKGKKLREIQYDSLDVVSELKSHSISPSPFRLETDWASLRIPGLDGTNSPKAHKIAPDTTLFNVSLNAWDPGFALYLQTTTASRIDSVHQKFAWSFAIGRGSQPTVLREFNHRYSHSYVLQKASANRFVPLPVPNWRHYGFPDYERDSLIHLLQKMDRPELVTSVSQLDRLVSQLSLQLTEVYFEVFGFTDAGLPFRKVIGIKW